jgi:hypothetical protein
VRIRTAEPERLAGGGSIRGRTSSWGRRPGTPGNSRTVVAAATALASGRGVKARRPASVESLALVAVQQGVEWREGHRGVDAEVPEQRVEARPR